MDHRDREELCNSAPEEESGAREKKRSRRVSFAEITSVHVFDRDDECDETPPDSKPSPQNTEPGQSREVLGFLRDFADSDDSKELSHNEEEDDDDEEEDEGQRGLFVRRMDSSSPGSAFGSATSNDEDDFFGPVSASFIKSGRLSDSAASDDNHDITLDSTAFSLHFRSLMQSKLEGNFKTPTRTQLSFEGKSPTENSTANHSGSFMVLTGDDKPIPRSSISGGKSSGGGVSNDDMSLIDDNPRMYDYGRLSPTLDALLAEGSKIMHDVSVSSQVNISKSSNYLNENSRCNTFDEPGSELKELKDSGDHELENIDAQDPPTEMVSVVNGKLSGGNGGSSTSLIDQISNVCSSSATDTLPPDASSLGHHNQTLKESPLRMPSDVLKVGGGSKSELCGGSNHNFRPPSEKIQMDMITKSDFGHVEDIINEDPLNGAIYTPDIGLKTNRSYDSPLEGSISSLGAKRQQILLDTTVLPRSELMTTPCSVKQPLSFLNNEDIRHNVSMSSIDTNTSKVKIPRTSLLGAALGVGDDNSEPVLSNYFRNSPFFATIGVESNKDPNTKEINVSVPGSVENLLSVPQENREERATREVGTYLVGTPRTIRTLRQKEVLVDTVHDGELKDQISVDVFCNDQNSELTTAVVLSSQFYTLRKEVQQHSFNHNLSVDALVIPESDSSQKIRFEFKKKSQETGTPEKFNCSPLKQLDQKLSASPENGCISEVLKQQKQYNKLVSSGFRKDSADSRAVISNMSHLSPMAEEPIMGSSLKGNIAHDTLLNQNNVDNTSTFIVNDNDTNNLENLKWISKSESLRHNLQKESENIGDDETPLRYRTTLSSQFGSAQRNFCSRTDPARLKEKVPEKTSSYDSASSYIRKRTATPTRLEKRLLDWLPQGPSTKEPNILSENGCMHPFVQNDPGSPTSVQCSNGQVHSGQCQDHPVLQKSLSVQDVELSRRKRRIEETILMDKDNIDEIGRIQKSPKVAPEMVGSMFPSEHCVIKNNETETVGDYASPRHWTYIFSKFSRATKGRLLALADNLNPKEVCVLEDMLGRLQKANKYKTLCNELQSQKIHDDVVILQQKRVAEARCLQQMLVYEQAKLQLLRLRHERLLNKIQLLQSGIQESQLLKLNSFSNLFLPGSRGVQCNESHLPSLSVDHNNKSGEAYDKVTSKRQELEALDQKVKGLAKSLISSCKIKGEPSSTDVVVLVNDHLKKRANCRFVRQDMQVWEVDDLESKNFQHNLVLNYCHFLNQRFKVNVGPVSSIVTINKLIDVNIMKSFPNINACTAFAFVFNGESTRNLGSPKKLALETQLTSLLLSNLLDVVEEAHMAHIELRNLIRTSFYSPGVEQLDLQLQFIDFKTGCKVTLTLDMTSLNRGVYPSEILPQLQTQTSRTQSSVTQLLLSEILAAVGGLKAGHSRIIRLCKCVSQVLKSRSM